MKLAKSIDVRRWSDENLEYSTGSAESVVTLADDFKNLMGYAPIHHSLIFEITKIHHVFLDRDVVWNVSVKKYNPSGEDVYNGDSYKIISEWVKSNVSVDVDNRVYRTEVLRSLRQFSGVEISGRKAFPIIRKLIPTARDYKANSGRMLVGIRIASNG